VVEVCLTAITTPSKGIPSYAHHPVKRLLAAGVRCALSCDNLLLSGDPGTAGPVDDDEVTGANGVGGHAATPEPQSAGGGERAGERINDGGGGGGGGGGAGAVAAVVPGGLGCSYAHPSGEVAHLVADCGASWAEARQVVLEGARAAFVLGGPHGSAVRPTGAAGSVAGSEEGGGGGGGGGGGAEGVGCYAADELMEEGLVERRVLAERRSLFLAAFERELDAALRAAGVMD
jgi:hypothetical protein